MENGIFRMRFQILIKLDKIEIEYVEQPVNKIEDYFATFYVKQKFRSLRMNQFVH